MSEGELIAPKIMGVRAVEVVIHAGAWNQDAYCVHRHAVSEARADEVSEVVVGNHGDNVRPVSGVNDHDHRVQRVDVRVDGHRQNALTLDGLALVGQGVGVDREPVCSPRVGLLVGACVRSIGPGLRKFDVVQVSSVQRA